MRLCFIGDSHLGHAGRAIQELVKRTPHQADLFIKRTYGTEPLTIQNRQDTHRIDRMLVDPRAGTAIQVEDYDLFVLVGMSISLIWQVEESVHFQRDTYRGPRPGQIASEAMYRHFLDGLFDTTRARLVLDSLQQLTDRPVWLIPQPLPLSWVRTRVGERFEVFRRLYDSGEADRTLADFERQLDRLRHRGVEVFAQPESTIVDQMFTHDDFGLADPADQSEASFYRRGDFYHMNRDFGDAQIRALYPRLGIG